MLSARDFELLLPWYVNGTLSDQERRLVAAYLKQHPVEDARVRWHSSLRAGIREQVDELPEDLGLDRVLAAVRRDTSRAQNSPRARGWRDAPANAATWLASLGLLGGSTRMRTTYWAAALASVVVLSGTLAFLIIDATAPEMMTEAAPPPAPVAVSTLPVPAAPPPAPSVGPAQQARAAPVKRSAVQQSTQGVPPSAPPALNETRLTSASAPDTRQQETPPSPTGKGKSEQTPVATAPAVVTPPPSAASTTAAPGSPPPPSAPASGSPTELATTGPDKRPATTEGNGATTVAKLSSEKSPLPDIAPRSGVALSGKENTSCPSPNKQREDALRAANPDQPVRTPAAWLEYIRELSKAGCREAAAKEWIEFHKKYPDEKIPPELTGSR